MGKERGAEKRRWREEGGPVTEEGDDQRQSTWWMKHKSVDWKTRVLSNQQEGNEVIWGHSSVQDKKKPRKLQIITIILSDSIQMINPSINGFIQHKTCDDKSSSTTELQRFERSAFDDTNKHADGGGGRAATLLFFDVKLVFLSKEFGGFGETRRLIQSPATKGCKLTLRLIFFKATPQLPTPASLEVEVCGAPPTVCNTPTMDQYFTQPHIQNVNRLFF